MHNVDRFDARAVTWFLRLYGLALVVDVATEIAAGVWQVHTGRFYPWRHIGVVPLYPPSILAIEWTLRAGAGLALLGGARRVRVVSAAVRVAAIVLFVAVLERYSNHEVLLFLVAFFLTIAPPDVRAADFDAREHPALGLVRAQLVIVYVFSAINKLAHGFGSGRSLVHLSGGAVSPAVGTALSIAVIATELAIPLLLVRRARLGVAVVVAMHAAFAVLVPGVFSFGLAMTALALLFVDRPRARGV